LGIEAQHRDTVLGLLRVEQPFDEIHVGDFN
jgi:hypothetical protein